MSEKYQNSTSLQQRDSNYLLFVYARGSSENFFSKLPDRDLFRLFKILWIVSSFPRSNNYKRGQLQSETSHTMTKLQRKRSFESLSKNLKFDTRWIHFKSLGLLHIRDAPMVPLEGRGTTSLFLGSCCGELSADPLMLLLFSLSIPDWMEIPKRLPVTTSRLSNSYFSRITILISSIKASGRALLHEEDFSLDNWWTLTNAFWSWYSENVNSDYKFGVSSFSFSDSQFSITTDLKSSIEILTDRFCP